MNCPASSRVVRAHRAMSSRQSTGKSACIRRESRCGHEVPPVAAATRPGGGRQHRRHPLLEADVILAIAHKTMGRVRHPGGVLLRPRLRWPRPLSRGFAQRIAGGVSRQAVIGTKATSRPRRGPPYHVAGPRAAGPQRRPRMGVAQPGWPGQPSGCTPASWIRWSMTCTLGPKIGKPILAAWNAKEDLLDLLALARTNPIRSVISYRLTRFHARCADSGTPELERLASTVATWSVRWVSGSRRPGRGQWGADGPALLAELSGRDGGPGRVRGRVRWICLAAPSTSKRASDSSSTDGRRTVALAFDEAIARCTAPRRAAPGTPPARRPS